MTITVNRSFRLPSMEKPVCLMADDDHTPPVNLTLRNLDEKWRTILRHADSPSLLGLASLEAAECKVLTAAVDQSLRTLIIPKPAHRSDGLIRLLAIYPAAMAVWLSRLAGQAYEVNFWDNFAALLHCTEVPSDRRPQFATAFRRACRAVMANFVTPEVGTWKYAGEFLFQAGLPLCHCGRFAVALRAVAVRCHQPGAWPTAPGAWEWGGSEERYRNRTFRSSPV